MMKKSIIISLALFLSFSLLATGQQIAKGKVFIDKNKNGIPDNNEKGISGVCVSNGREVVVTDKNGKWELPVQGNTSIFVIKPSGYITHVNEYQIPQYYYNHFPEGSTDLKVPGVKPSGKLPENINFPLYENGNEKEFSAILFGDPQARGIKEINFITKDVVQELIGTDAAFGVTLGDLTADGPALFGEISQSIGQIGIPWYYIMGNHDYNRDAVATEDYDASFVRHFGPSTYAFEYGEVVFIGLNAIKPKEEGKKNYRFSDKEIAFFTNYLKNVPQNKLVVFMMHVPIMACGNVEPLYNLIASREHSLSISAHTHTLHHVFLDKKMGYNGDKPHHHYISPTVSGSWWCGLYDERGIPHATMNDGVPNGYSYINFNGNKYSISFKAAGRPKDYQMNIYMPDDVIASESANTDILVNVFAGSEKSVTEMKVSGLTEWLKMEQIKTIDPECLRMHKLSPYLDIKYEGKTLDEVFGWKMDYPSKTSHMWTAKLPAKLPEGTHTLIIKTKDMFGKEWIAYRVFRIN